jgi:hypothetical protein
LTGKKLKGNWVADNAIKAAMQGTQAEEIESLVKQFQNALTNEANAFGYFKEKLFRAIDYAIRRHDWYEDQRSRVLQQTMTISFAILTISLGVTSLLIQKAISSSELFATLAGFIGLAVISIGRSAWLYNAELDIDRPYRLVSDIRFWFFRYNLPKASRELLSGDTVRSLAAEVIDERKRFFERIGPNLSLDRSMREDLEQLFILQVLQRSKSESLLKLRWLLAYLALFTAIEVIIVFLLLVAKSL